MRELIEELENAEIKQDSDVDFYNGVIYALWKIGRFNTMEKTQLENDLQIRLYQKK